MSRMSPPTPIYNVKRSEDLANLNQILSRLSVDERARILTAGNVTLLRGAGVSNASTTATVTMKYSPYVFAFVTLDNTTFYPLPFHTYTTGAAMAITEAVVMESVANAGGTTTITFRALANDTTKANAKTWYIYYLVLKDKIIPTTSIIGT